MFSNVTAVCLSADFGVSHGEWNARPRSEVHSSPRDQQPFTGSDFGNMPRRRISTILVKKKKKWLQRTVEYT